LSLLKEFSVAEIKKTPAGPKVSPARTAVSLVLLLIVGAICFIELRAGLGQMLSGKALAAKANDGEFTDLSLEEARGLFSLAPKETIETRGPDSVHRYEWYSMLRPLMGQSNPQITIIASNDEKPMALAFTTAEEDRKPELPVSAADGSAGGATGGAAGMMEGGMGMGNGMGGGSGMGGGGGDGRKRPDMEDSPASADPAAEEPATEEPAAEKAEPAAEDSANAAEPESSEAP